MADNYFSGMLGKAETAIKSRKQRLQDAEDEAVGVKQQDRTKQNEDAANGRTRLTTEDKKR